MHLFRDYCVGEMEATDILRLRHKRTLTETVSILSLGSLEGAEASI